MSKLDLQHVSLMDSAFLSNMSTCSTRPKDFVGNLFKTATFTLHNARWSTDHTALIITTPCKTAFHIYHGHIFPSITGFQQLQSPWNNISIQTAWQRSWSVSIDSSLVCSNSLRELLSELHCKPKGVWRMNWLTGFSMLSVIFTLKGTLIFFSFWMQMTALKNILGFWKNSLSPMQGCRYSAW